MDPEKKINEVTLKSIAQEAGLSVSAVSKALHNKPDISLETITQVHKIGKKLGYRPNIIARSLRTGKTNIVGVIIPDNCNPYNALVLKGVEETLQNLGYTAIMGNSKENPEIEEKLLTSMVSLKVDGILIIPITLQNFINVNIPYVFMSRSPYLVSTVPGLDHKAINFVVNDDRYGEYLAARHLIEQGHKNIYLLVGNDNYNTIEGGMNRARIAGYCQALKEANIPFDPSKIRYGVVDILQSSNATKEILKTEKPPYAFCVTSDYSAFGVISVLSQSGLHIPNEAAIVGYDDIEIASHTNPGLTTIRQEKYSIGSRSAELLISLIKGESEANQIILKPTLVVRSTT